MIFQHTSLAECFLNNLTAQNRASLNKHDHVAAKDETE